MTVPGLLQPGGGFPRRMQHFKVVNNNLHSYVCKAATVDVKNKEGVGLDSNVTMTVSVQCGIWNTSIGRKLCQG